MSAISGSETSFRICKLSNLNRISRIDRMLSYGMLPGLSHVWNMCWIPTPGTSKGRHLPIWQLLGGKVCVSSTECSGNLKQILHTAEIATKSSDGLVETARLMYLSRQKKERSRVIPPLRWMLSRAWLCFTRCLPFILFFWLMLAYSSHVLDAAVEHPKQIKSIGIDVGLCVSFSSILIFWLWASPEIFTESYTHCQTTRQGSWIILPTLHQIAAPPSHQWNQPSFSYALSPRSWYIIFTEQWRLRCIEILSHLIFHKPGRLQGAETENLSWKARGL